MEFITHGTDTMTAKEFDSIGRELRRNRKVSKRDPKLYELNLVKRYNAAKRVYLKAHARMLETGGVMSCSWEYEKMRSLEIELGELWGYHTDKYIALFDY